MTPKPWLVGRVLFEGETDGSEMGNAFVEVFALEVEDNVVRYDNVISDIDRERRFTIRTFEPGITRQGIDDSPESELFKKLDGFYRFFRKDGDLVKPDRPYH